MLHGLSNPDIHLLRVFAAVVECGGFSAAQISLNVAQSTISTQMADLEARLGMRLCNRGRAGFSLTDDGRAVYDAAISLFRSLDQFTGRVNDRRGGLAGELRIAFADALVGNKDFLLDQAILRFREKAPEVLFDFKTVNPLEVEQGVLDERFHIGIHTFPTHAPGLVYHKLFAEEQMLFCGQGHRFFSLPAAKLVPAEIEAEPFVRRAYYGGALQTGAFRPKTVAATADSMEAIALLVLSGEFIGHLPAKWASGGSLKGQLRSLLPKRFAYDSQFEVVVRTGASLTKLIDTFLTELFAVYGTSARTTHKKGRTRAGAA